jgi:radical SAM-linked protein
MSQGYNPRPQISIPAPLSVAFSGENEVLDFELCRWLRPDEVEGRLAEELPQGIALKSMKSTPTKPDRRPRFFSYRIPLREGHPVTRAALDRLLGADELIVERTKKGKVKTRDIAGRVRALRLEQNDLHMLLAMTDRGTARPEEVLQALNCRPGRDYLKSSITRVHVDLSSSL